MPARHQKAAPSMRRLLSAATATLALSLGFGSPALAQSGLRLELTHVPAEARNAFFSGIDELANWFPSRGLARLDQALVIDPEFGLARVFRAVQSTSMDAETRAAELDRGVRDSGAGTAGEAIFAMALRARRLNQAEEAQGLFETARQLLPGDPYVAYFAIENPIAPGVAPPGAWERVTTAFPDFAPAYNNYGYDLYRTGDRQGGIQSVQKYAELAADHPNAKDSYAEILQWEGFFDEAVLLYREAIALDPSFAEAYIGIADARQLQGRGTEARAALAEGLAVAPTRSDSVTLRRLTGLSYGADGNRRAADETMQQAMRDASLIGTPGVGWHRDFARIAVMARDSRAVASHLEATSASNPNALVIEAMLFASVGLNSDARGRLETAKQVPGAERFAYFQSINPIVEALILVNEGRGDEALRKIRAGDVTMPIAKAVMALAEQQRRNLDTARLLRDSVLSDRIYSLIDRDLFVARALAVRIK